MAPIGFVLSIWLQTPTPLPALPFWQMTEDRIPYVILLGVALLTFILGSLARPLLEDAASALRRWVKSWGKRSSFQQSYLTSLINQHSYLPLLPLNVATAQRDYQNKAVKLEELFTPLSLGSTQNEEGGERLVAPGRTRQRLPQWVQGLWARLRPVHKPSAGDVGQVIWQQPRLVIRGDPGAGKSTLLRYLTLSCARSRRADRSLGDRRDLVRRRLGWRQRPFPILVTLNLLGDVANWPDDRRLLTELRKTLPAELREHCPEDFFARQLARGNCLVLFDGFDELGSRAARGRLARMIDDLITTYGGRDNHFIVSTRIVGYEGQLDNYGFTVRTVQDLDDEAIRQLVTLRYRAVAIGEGAGRPAPEQQELVKFYAQRTADLLEKLPRNQGLRILTTNPLLLSLIVLVHKERYDLPQQRHLLYRDCVEILTERWQSLKRNTVGLLRPTDDLTLGQKVLLLQELAFTMQQRRQGLGSQVVIARDEATTLLAARLPSFLAAHLPTSAAARQQACSLRAQTLLDNIREESGILVEKGLDEAGEPVIAFSHLTFQEYLAADALREQPEARPILLRQLFHPAWREVLLLYVSMVDAGEVVQACLDVGDQLPLTRWLLAGRCLAEKVTVAPQLRQQVTTALADYLGDPQITEPLTVNALIYNIGREENYDWLLGNLGEVTNPAERAALAATTPAARRQALQQLLLRLLTTNHRGPAGAILSGLGDPRDLDTWVTIPAGFFRMGSAEDDRYATSGEKPQHEVTVAAFAISQYPVTNGQYERFVQAVGHAPPHHWRQGASLPWLRNHPVVNVSWHDAQAYCRWLSSVKGRSYRLPSEAEWEKAARGASTGSATARIWPWGNEPPTAELCNFNQNVGTTTAVGAYPAGASPDGCLDMAGNVWEWTSTLWGKDWQKPEYGYPYRAEDGREQLDAPNTVLRTLRGGSWIYNVRGVRCAYRFRSIPANWFSNVGFRVVSPGS